MEIVIVIYQPTLFGTYIYHISQSTERKDSQSHISLLIGNIERQKKGGSSEPVDGIRKKKQ